MIGLYSETLSKMETSVLGMCCYLSILTPSMLFPLHQELSRYLINIKRCVDTSSTLSQIRKQ